MNRTQRKKRLTFSPHALVRFSQRVRPVSAEAAKRIIQEALAYSRKAAEIQSRPSVRLNGTNGGYETLCVTPELECFRVVTNKPITKRRGIRVVTVLPADSLLIERGEYFEKRGPWDSNGEPEPRRDGDSGSTNQEDAA